MSSVEEKLGDRSKIAKASGASCIIVGHSEDGKRTRIRMPSGARRSVPSASRAMLGVVAGGGRLDKPMLKAGNNFHKFRVKRNCWPKARQRLVMSRFGRVARASSCLLRSACTLLEDATCAGT